MPALRYIVGAYFLANFILGFVVAWAASRRGREGIAWWFMCLFFGPVVALLALIAAPTMREEIDQR